VPAKRRKLRRPVAWLAERGGIGAREVCAGVRQVRAFLEAHGTSRFAEIRQYSTTVSGQHIAPLHEELHDDRTTNRCGWRRRDGDQWTYFVLPKAWRTEVCRGIDGEMTARALADRDLLKREGKNLTCKVTIPANRRPPVYVVSGAFLEGEAD
jgi:putative DNA primase/helicase